MSQNENNEYIDYQDEVNLEEESNFDVNSLSFEMDKKLRFYLAGLIEHGGSDLHIKSGSYYRGRIQGEMIKLSDETLTYKDGLQLAKEVLKGRFKDLVRDKSVDFNYKLNEKYRFRGNMFFQADGVSAVFRVIQGKSADTRMVCMSRHHPVRDTNSHPHCATFSSGANHLQQPGFVWVGNGKTLAFTAITILLYQ